MILSRFVGHFLQNLPCTDKDDTVESRKYHHFQKLIQAAGAVVCTRVVVKPERKVRPGGLNTIEMLKIGAHVLAGPASRGERGRGPVAYQRTCGLAWR